MTDTTVEYILALLGVEVESKLQRMLNLMEDCDDVTHSNYTLDAISSYQEAVKALHDLQDWIERRQEGSNG